MAVLSVLQPSLQEGRGSAVKQEVITIVRRILSSGEGQEALRQMSDSTICDSNGGVQDQLFNGVVPFIQNLNSSFLTITLDDQCNWHIPGRLYISPEGNDQEDNDSPPAFHRYIMKISLVRFDYMLRTTDQEVFKLFKLELCLTLLGGIAWIFEKHVYDVIGRKPAEGRRKKAKDVLEHYLFGGSVHWYHPLNNINAFGAPYQEEVDNDYVVWCSRFRPQFIDALLNGQPGAGQGRFEGAIDRINLAPSYIVPPPSSSQ